MLSFLITDLYQKSGQEIPAYRKAVIEWIRYKYSDYLVSGNEELLKNGEYVPFDKLLGQQATE